MEVVGKGVDVVSNVNRHVGDVGALDVRCEVVCV